MKIEVYAPAKLNLLLKVLSKRPDGYHNIFSLVDIIDLFDVMKIEEIEEEKILINDRKGILPEGRQNTVFRIFSLLKERYSIKKGVKVDIEKNIPIGGGLGGSSTDAATFLKVINRIWNLDLSFEELIEIGKKVGSDIPLFIYGGPCIIKGRGEKIEPFDLPELSYLIVYPGIPLEAKTVYEKIILTKKGYDIKLKKLKDFPDLFSILENDLEDVAISLCPQIGEIKSELQRQGALVALLCGSGSSVFGIFSEKERERKAAIEMRKKGWYTFQTRSLRRQKDYENYRG